MPRQKKIRPGSTESSLLMQLQGTVLKKKEYPSYTDVFSKELCIQAAKNPKIVAVTAAMPDGTGLKPFKKQFPDRFFDVGIAEQHAVTSAAGMAAAGMKASGCRVLVVFAERL